MRASDADPEREHRERFEPPAAEQQRVAGRKEDDGPQELPAEDQAPPRDLGRFSPQEGPVKARERMLRDVGREQEEREDVPDDQDDDDDSDVDVHGACPVLRGTPRTSGFSCTFIYTRRSFP